MTRTRSDRRSGAWPPALTSIGTFMVARDALVVITALPAIHRAPQAKIEAFRQRIGRTLPWHSSRHSDFQTRLRHYAARTHRTHRNRRHMRRPPHMPSRLHHSHRGEM